jgi:hypothetical protein
VQVALWSFLEGGALKMARLEMDIVFELKGWRRRLFQTLWVLALVPFLRPWACRQAVKMFTIVQLREVRDWGLR